MSIYVYMHIYAYQNAYNMYMCIDRQIDNSTDFRIQLIYTAATFTPNTSTFQGSR